eukprot:321412-Amphidinium_carterae.1
MRPVGIWLNMGTDARAQVKRMAPCGSRSFDVGTQRSTTCAESSEFSRTAASRSRQPLDPSRESNPRAVQCWRLVFLRLQMLLR